MRVCVSLAEDGIKEAVAAGVIAIAKGADLLEVRFDLMKKLPEDLSLFRRLTVPRIATLRTEAQGGMSAHGDEERLRFFRRAVRIGFENLDIEHDSPLIYRLSRELRTVRIVCSYHDLAGTPSTSNILDKLIVAASRGDLAKAAFKVNNIGDIKRLVESARLFSVTGNKFVLIGMGELGRITRVMSGALGCAFTYASLESGKEPPQGSLMDHDQYPGRSPYRDRPHRFPPWPFLFPGHA
jgi:3-dehydroquinate dehydratase type I